MTPPRRAPARKSIREVKQENQRALDFYAFMSDRPRIVIDIPEKRERAPAAPRQHASEAEVLKAVMALLKRHPKVAMCWRQNSGTFAERNSDGSTRYVRANSQRGMSDIMGTMRDGRVLAVEVKSQTGRVQPHQQEFLYQVRKAGGVAGVVRSVEDAVALLASA